MLGNAMQGQTDVCAIRWAWWEINEARRTCTWWWSSFRHVRLQVHHAGCKAGSAVGSDYQLPTTRVFRLSPRPAPRLVRQAGRREPRGERPSLTCSLRALRYVLRLLRTGRVSRSPQTTGCASFALCAALRGAICAHAYYKYSTRHLLFCGDSSEGRAGLWNPGRSRPMTTRSLNGSCRGMSLMS